VATCWCEYWTVLNSLEQPKLQREVADPRRILLLRRPMSDFSCLFSPLILTKSPIRGGSYINGTKISSSYLPTYISIYLSIYHHHNHLAVSQLRRLFAGFSQRRPGFEPGSQVMWDLWWTEQHWGTFCPSILVSPITHSLY
jgi:hypothetical protein